MTVVPVCSITSSSVGKYLSINLATPPIRISCSLSVFTAFLILSISSFGCKDGTLSITINGIPSSANLIALLNAFSPYLALYTIICFGLLPNNLALSLSNEPSTGSTKHSSCCAHIWYASVVFPALSAPNISIVLPLGIPPPIMLSKSANPVLHLGILSASDLLPKL